MRWKDKIGQLFTKASRKALILYYHRVVPTVENDPLLLKVSCEMFKEQVALLINHYVVISLDNLLDQMKTGKLRKSRQVVITFDDGYSDNLRYAAPLLKKFQCPATFFVSTDYIQDRNPFWWESVNWNGNLFRDEEVVHRVRKMSPAIRDQFLRENLLEKTSNANPNDGPMSWEDLSKLAENFTVGSHTCSHTALTSLLEVDIKREMVESKSILQTNLNREVDLFSYPYGEVGYFDEQTKKCAMDAGYRCALTTVPKSVKADDDLFALGRVVVRNENGKSLMRKLNKVLMA